MTAIAVTIAGSDSSGGAGLQADLKTFSALGVYGASIVTALTAQNTQKVTAIHDIPASFVKEQMDAVFSDLAVDAVKIGMLFQSDVIKIVAENLMDYPSVPVVLDPVMIATSGDPLLTQSAVSVLWSSLLRQVTLITPNLHEAAHLTGMPVAETEAEMEKQADNLLEQGVRAVLIKGGHSMGDQANDLFSDRVERYWLSAPRLDTSNTHGTGCTLSSAIAADLAKGKVMRDALEAAKAFVTGAIAGADRLDIGYGHGPTHHFHNIWQDE